jgi:short-subunit dehydrogenase
VTSTSTPTAGPQRALAVVTGASSGIGRELAKQFAQHQFDVVVCAEDDGIHQSTEQLERFGVTAHAVQADLATADGVDELHRSVLALERPVAAAALNAGVGVHGRFDQTPLEDDLRLIALNVTSTVHLAKLLLPAMVARGEGRVLLTASIASRMPGPYYATYAASKSFVHSFAEAVRDELRDTGVTVTSLMPGPTDTDFFDRAGMQDTKVASSDKDDPSQVARQGFEALMAGKDHVVAGSRKNAVQAAGASVMPDKAAAAAQRRKTEPGSG